MRRSFVQSMLLGALFVSNVSALPFNQFIVFGDSLSDTGNVLNRTFGLYPEPPNYTKGRFTDGPDTTPMSTSPLGGVWHEQLAGFLGLPAATPYSSGGSNYAFGGATTGAGNENFGVTDNMYMQVQDYLSAHSTSSNALYTFWGGANDLLNAATASGASPQSVASAEKVAIFFLEIEMGALFNAGARQFMWLDLPPLQATPEARSLSPDIVNALATASSTFRADWLAVIPQFRSAGATITGVDVYSAFYLALNYPSALGLTNVTDSSQGTSANPDQYLFWDNLHPTTRGHTLVGFYAYQALTSGSQAGADFSSADFFAASSVPESSSALLICLGLVGLVFFKNWRR